MQKNNIKTILLNVIYPLLLVILFSCTQNQSQPKALVYNDFVSQIDSMARDGFNASDISYLRKKYPRFFTLWLYEVMDFGRFGPMTDSARAQYIEYWLEQNQPVFNAIRGHYAINKSWKGELDQAWFSLQEAIPNTPNAQIFSYLSQFSNYNTFVDTLYNQQIKQETLILAYSQEMFLNDTFPPYALLDLPPYFNRYNGSDQVASQLVWNYVKTQFEKNHKRSSMLDEMIFQGKIWYSVIYLFPKRNPWEILGYDQTEWKWMQREEGQIWKHYLDNRLLFSNKFNDYKRYFAFGNKTFGNGVPPECPPLIGNFSGLRIVQSYVEKNDASLAQVWKITNSNEILQGSAYNPIK